MTIQQGLDGNWYAVWDFPGAAELFEKFFPGSRPSCFGQFENALQLTFHA